MDDELIDEIAAGVERVCADFDDNYWSRCDADHEFPWDFYKAMASGGWVGISIPSQYGGGGQGIGAAGIVLNRVAASGAAMNGSSALHLNMFGLNPVVKFGSDRLKETFLPRAASGELHVAFGVTEPDAGTDTSRIVTRAIADGPDRYIISGRKIWTTKALEAEVCLLLVRTDGEPGDLRGLTLFLVDLDPNYCEVVPIPKLGRNAVASCEVAYDDLPVESWRLVGERGKGFSHILHGLNPERILLAAMSCGIGEAALRRAVSYATEREVFGRAIGSNQAIAHPLASAHMHLNAAGLMWRQAADSYDSGAECAEDANTAKYLAAEACWSAADSAMQTHGGLGYATEYHIERYWREARLQRIAPISQEMTLNFIAHNVLGLPKSY
ncbi:acyl-CoA/acyl-ACP dehydrogenase [Acidimicrobiaceae bacterium AH-315-P05]|nr:acyl-CoA/acyl-ACP dehydrogenase [Acidimicrobiaceae bacterium AH-315-P05]